jgi:antitoxin VapB
MNDVKQLNIKNAETYRLAAKLAALTGESVTAAVTEAIREKIEREQTLRDREGRLARIMELSRISSSWPDWDTRSLEEILGYDENGLPT